MQEKLETPIKKKKTYTFSVHIYSPPLLNTITFPVKGPNKLC